MTPTQETTVREIALANPASVPVFESFQIDYCCGGRQSLEAACARAGVSIDTVARALAVENVPPTPATDWSRASLNSLIRHILTTHHAYIRETAPRILSRLGKVASKHAETHPEVVEIAEIFSALEQELGMHCLREEQILFPYITRMEAKQPVASCFASVSMPISRMVEDHDDAGELLARLRNLTNGYQPFPGACPTVAALYYELGEFEKDLRQHIHLENNILFPRAVELEAELAG